MQSFRTELENPVVEKDIIELEKKINAFKNGEMDEDRFRSLRLARGVYGQRQPGVQMVRIKLPFGRCTPAQLRKLAEVSDNYSTGNLHITTRQDIQIHYVSLEKTPELWAELERDAITLREACGNTVRNITASSMSGIDPEEHFDVSPYAQAMFEYFLRNPICQDMGRKFKIAFSSSEKDDAYTFAHDLGFIPMIQNGEKGFKVVIGGGIGSQPRHADLLYGFLHVDKIIPLTEAVLRVFDRYGERVRRHKARLKFLINDIGLNELRKLIDEQLPSLPHLTYPIDEGEPYLPNPTVITEDSLEPQVPKYYSDWLKFNSFPQKQKGYHAIGIKITTGDLSSNQARLLADIMDVFKLEELRFTVNQGILLRFVPDRSLPALYQSLSRMGFADIGFDSLLDIVACPGTDTCNLGIASSMGLAKELERMLKNSYADIIHHKNINIKISGCMNACGQHTVADIGFQGMTIKAGQLVAPATQILLGGGRNGDGSGRYADKVTKVPSRKVPAVLQSLLDDFIEHSDDIESYGEYYQRKGTDYFYQMLKEYADTSALTRDDFIDWGEERPYEKAIGIGECAGVMVDLVATLLAEAQEKLENAQEFHSHEQFADAIYSAYTAMLYAAKAVLTTTEAKLNTQAAIVRSYDEYFGNTSPYYPGSSFESIIYKINTHAPSQKFSSSYLAEAERILTIIVNKRLEEISDHKSHVTSNLKTIQV